MSIPMTPERIAVLREHYGQPSFDDQKDFACDDIAALCDALELAGVEIERLRSSLTSVQILVHGNYHGGYKQGKPIEGCVGLTCRVINDTLGR